MNAPRPAGAGQAAAGRPTSAEAAATGPASTAEAAAHAASTAAADTHAEIIAVEDRRRRALVAVDLDELDELFAEDLVHIHSIGLTHDKPALLAHIDRKRAFLSVERGELDIRIIDRIAIVVGQLRNRMRTPDGGQTLLEGVATQVLRREERGWRFIHFQLTPTIRDGRDDR